MIKTSTILNSDMQKELSKNIMNIFNIFKIIGIIGLVSYIILNVFFKNVVNDIFLNILIVLSATLFSFGLIFNLSIKKLIKNLDKNDLVENNYEFYDDHIFISSRKINQSEPFGTLKLKYVDILKTTESNNYFFIYNTKTTVFPILKKNLSPDDELSLRNILKIKKLKIN